jgi:hypothetical protein
MNAEKVLPEPVGAVITTFFLIEMSLNENLWGGVRVLNLVVNHFLTSSSKQARDSSSDQGFLRKEIPIALQQL